MNTQPITQLNPQDSYLKPTQTPTGELPYQTYERLMNKRWPGGFSPEVQSLLKQHGITAPMGSAEANLGLQKALIKGQTVIPEQKPEIKPKETQAMTTTSEKIEQPSDFQSLLNQYGVSITESQPKIEDVIKQVSSSFGFTEINKEMTDLDNELIDQQFEVQDNPWLSQDSKTKRISILQDKYDRKKDALVDRLRLQQDVMGKTLDYYYKEREYRKDLLFKQLDLMSKELDKKAFELSPGQVRYEYNPETGEYEEVAREAAKLEKPTAPTADVKAIAYDEVKQKAIQIFEKDRQQNADKKISPDVYRQARNELKSLGLGTYLDDFDRAFGDLLSDETKAKFGISKKTSTTTDIGAVLDAFINTEEVIPQ